MTEKTKTRAQRILERAAELGRTGRIVRQRDAAERRGRTPTQHFSDIGKGWFPPGERLGPRARIYDESVFLAEEQLRAEERDAEAGMGKAA